MTEDVIHPKPRLRFNRGQWLCFCLCFCCAGVGYGSTPKEAFDEWRTLV